MHPSYHLEIGLIVDHGREQGGNCGLIRERYIRTMTNASFVSPTLLEQVSQLKGVLEMRLDHTLYAMREREVGGGYVFMGVSS